MSNPNSEYIDMFRAEAQEGLIELNRSLIQFESDQKEKKYVDIIFRIIHTIKGNAMSLGIVNVGELSHVFENVFEEVKKGNVILTSEIFAVLFKVLDKITECIEAIHTDKVVRYKGVRTKLSVALKTSLVKSEIAASGEDKKTQVNVESFEDNKVDTPSEASFSDYINVPVTKLDELLNLVGELLVEKDSLMIRGRERLMSFSEFTRLHRVASDLQYSVMGIRLVKIGFVLNKFHRTVRDVATQENKKVNLTLTGGDTEIDRNVLKILSESLIHLVRNAVSHGIELPSDRGDKNECGTIEIKAYNNKDSVILEVKDDGAGIDENQIIEKAISKELISLTAAQNLTKEEKMRFIFEPGLSNAKAVTDVSGRGVGMDVVKNATESIGGFIDVQSEIGKGTSMVLTLPTSMALKGALLFVVATQRYAIPLVYTDAVISINKSELSKVSGGIIGHYLGKTMSVVFMKDLFFQSDFDYDYHQSLDEIKEGAKLNLVLVKYEGVYLGVIVDKLLQRQEIIEKKLSKPLSKLPFFSGVTILGDGQVCLVLNIPSVFKQIVKIKSDV